MPIYTFPLPRFTSHHLSVTSHDVAIPTLNFATHCLHQTMLFLCCTQHLATPHCPAYAQYALYAIPSLNCARLYYSIQSHKKIRHGITPDLRHNHDRHTVNPLIQPTKIRRLTGGIIHPSITRIESPNTSLGETCKALQKS